MDGSSFGVRGAIPSPTNRQKTTSSPIDLQDNEAKFGRGNVVRHQSKSRKTNVEALHSDGMRRLRAAADPHIERIHLRQEEEERRLWEEEHREVDPSSSPAFDGQEDCESDLLEAKESKRKTLGMSALGHVLKKAQEAAGLCISELPEQFFEAEDVELGVWAALVNDNALRKLAKSNVRRMEEGVVPGSQLRGNQLVEKAGALDLMTNMFSTGQARAEGEIIKIPFAGIRSLIIPNADKVTDAGLLTLATTCTSLYRLNLDGCVNITDVSLRTLAKQNLLLEELSLNNCPNIHGAGLVAIGECCGRLKILRMRNSPASEEWLLKRIATGLPNLREINLSHSNKVSDETLRTLSNRCPKLEKIDLHHCREVSDVGVLSITEWCPGLEYLDLTRYVHKHKITDVCLLSLAERCQSLTTLILRGNEFLTDVGVSWLASGCNALIKLDIAKCFKVSDVGLRAIGDGCPELEWLDISDLKTVTDVGIRSLGEGCKKLKHLNCTNVYLLTDGVQRDFAIEGLQYMLNECKDLQDLILSGCFQIGPRIMKLLSTGIDPLTELRSGNLGHPLSVLSLQRLPKITAGCLEPVLKGRGAETLTVLNLNRCENIRDKILTLVGKHCMKLRTLILSNCPNISTRGIQSLCRGKRGKALEILDLTNCEQVNDLALLALSESGFDPGLKKLNLKGCKNITETGISWLAEGLSSLYEINLKGCDAISLRGLQAIVGRWKFVKVYNNHRADFFGIYPEDKCVDMRFIEDYGLIWKAATLIQNTYRTKIARREAERKREIRLMNWTARKLQSYWRGRVARRYALLKRLQRDREVEAAIKMQCAFRSRVARRKAAVEQERVYREKCVRAAIYIQNKWRGKVARDMLQLARRTREEYRNKCEIAAIKLQRIWRGAEGRRNFQLFKAQRLLRMQEEEAAASKLQSLLRGRKARKDAAQKRRLKQLEHDQMIRAAIKMQRILRGRLARRKLHSKKDEQALRERAAVKLQCMWRAKKGQFAMHLLRHAKQAARTEAAARRVQAAWRAKKGKMTAHMLRLAKRLQADEQEQAATKLQLLFRGRKARKRAVLLKTEKLDVIQRQHDLNTWAAIMVQRHFRGQVGRKRAAIMREEKKKRWKEMFDYEQDRTFYYNQDTGEVRWRMPQDLLDLLPKPVCSNCEDHDALLECGSCTEFFCEKCWNEVHFGGFRKDHIYRALYDTYNKRVDYGDGEWPSVWPTEIEQDDILGWQRIKRAEQKDRGEEITFGIPGLDPEAEIQKKKVETSSKKRIQHEEDDQSLPEDDMKTPIWRKLYDFEEDRELYIDVARRKVQFDRPSSYRSPREDACWKEYYDDMYQCTYYYNHKTGESTYEKPANFQESDTSFNNTNWGSSPGDEATPPDNAWEKQFDAQTGRAFYHNPATGISVYERPAEYQTPREEREAEQARQREGSEWIMCYEEDSGLEYYYNPKTRAAQYERPPAYFTPREDQWVKYFDEYAQREYYYNERTGVSQYMRPDGFETPRIEGLEEGENGWCKYPDPQTGVMVYKNKETGVIQYQRPHDFLALTLEEEQELADAWEEFWDDTNQCPYFYNAISGESTYEKPQEMFKLDDLGTQQHDEQRPRDLEFLNEVAVPSSNATGANSFQSHVIVDDNDDDQSWMVNDDWTDQGVEKWLDNFKNHHKNVLEIKTPVLRPEVRDIVIHVCEQLDLDSVTQGFGKMRAVLISRPIDD